MKKWALVLLVAVMMVLAACGNSKNEDEKSSAKDENKTITYKSEEGDIKVPAAPKRVVALTNSGNLLALGINLVGTEEWSKKSPLYEEDLKDVETVSDQDVEKISALKPDLIVAANTNANLDKLKKVAPTVTYTYNKVDYLEQHIELGKLVNKEDEATKWVADYKEKAAKLGEEVKAKIGEDATVTVLESYNKSMSVLGTSWGRGTEVLYQEMGMKMPQKVTDATKKDGYFTLSQEVLSDYVGDYLILSKYADQDNSFQETKSFKNMSAAKEGHVYEANAYAFMYNDPIAIDYQLDFFKESFLGK